MSAEQIARELLYNYNYYSTVYFDFIVEAVKNTLQDFRTVTPTIDEIHRHITKNYI